MNRDSPVKSQVRALPRRWLALPAVFAFLRCAGGEHASNEPPGVVCVAGDQKGCACPGGTEGVQVCADDGSKYEVCTGCPSEATGGGPGPSSTGGAGNVAGGSGGAPGTGGRATGGGPANTGGAPSGTGGGPGTGGLGATATGESGGIRASGGAGTGGLGVGGSAAVGGATGGNTGTAGGSGSGGAIAVVGVSIVPDATGRVAGATNSLMVQGPWYAYGDGIGADGTTATGICEMRGGHPPAACSMITTPRPGPFANTGGRMCTIGVAAMVIAGANALPDYANITGAGIGLDLNNGGTPIPVRGVFNATAKGVTGVAFDLDTVPSSGLRVEFPIPATDGTSAGAAYFGANTVFASSPVVVGTNVVRWADVRVPGSAPLVVFDPAAIESVLFHVPTNTLAAGPYGFCISNLKMLTQ